MRKFCSCCGASLIFESKFNRQDNTIEIALASFDHFAQDDSLPESLSQEVNSQENVPQPDVHIYTATKVKWLTINDGLPQYQAYRISLKN